MRNVSCILRAVALILSSLALVCTIVAILQDKFDFTCLRSNDPLFEDDFDDDEFEDWDD